MLRSGSCEGGRHALDYLMSGRADELVRRLPYVAQQGADLKTLRKVAGDFASLFYSLLIQQMQKTVRQDEQDSPVAQGVQDFFGMFLPRAIAGHRGDALSQYIFEQLRTRCGDVADETV